MKKCFVIGLIMALVPQVGAIAAQKTVDMLIAEKQAKMKKLESCKGTTKGLKIAGLSTLGITAVGVAGNIAEAVVLNDYKDKVNKEKTELEKQRDLNYILWSQRTANQPQTANSKDFATEAECKASCNTTTGCFRSSVDKRWQCVADSPENSIQIVEHKPFISISECMDYCAETCVPVDVPDGSPALYRCHKSKDQAAAEQKQRAELDEKAGDMYAIRLGKLRDDYIKATDECINNEYCPQTNMTDLAKAYREDFNKIVAETEKVKDKVTPFDKNQQASIIEDAIKLQENKYANKRPAPSAEDKLVPGLLKELEQNEKNGILAAEEAKMDKEQDCMMSQVTAEGKQRLRDLINKIANNPNHWVNTQRVTNEREIFSKNSMRGSCKKGQLYKECEGQAYEIRVLEAAEQEYEQIYCK